MYLGNEVFNQRSFKRDAKRGWVQFAICNRSRYQASARDLDFQKLCEKIKRNTANSRNAFYEPHCSPT